ncbi:uncharacterized protein LOC112099754 [Citrus clementina]|uniref:uncharacterized protein LOC112099754 n=1 Tax=Citrus clementina TaxID=85681 RepID=UPI000CED7207|nr:uncharacterized protein LOC112099754 [Citrus x clementina]
MSKCKEKVIEIDDDELDFLPSLLADPAFDLGIPLEPIKSNVGTSARRMSPQITSSTSNNGDDGSSGSEDTLSEDLGEDSGEMSLPGTSRPDRKSKVGGKKDTPSRPPRGYVTLFLESFKFGMRYCQNESTVDEVKHLYQLKSSPKDASLYYFMSSTKTRKPITDLSTSSGGNWKKKFFFAGGPWGQVAQIDGKNYRVLSRFVVPGSWGVHYKLKHEPLKCVEAVLANSCSSQELLSTYNFFESRLVSTDLKMEDTVIGALNRKRPRLHAAKRDQNKDSPSAKWVNIAEQVPPLRTLPPPPTKAGETSGTTTDPTSPPPPVGSKPRLPDNRAEHLVPYISEFSRLVSKKDLEDFDGSTLGELVGAMQYSAFHLGCMATYYKGKVGRYDRKMREDFQSAKNKADAAEKKAGDLNLENLKLIEWESLAQAKAITLEKELNKVKEDLQKQKATYETQLESLKDSHQVQVENLEKEADNKYDQGLRYSYRCIMAVLGKQHPDMKMDELAVGVAQYRDDEAAKEDVEVLEPNATEEGTSPPRAVPADVAEASTPSGATGETPCS